MSRVFTRNLGNIIQADGYRRINIPMEWDPKDTVTVVLNDTTSFDNKECEYWQELLFGNDSIAINACRLILNQLDIKEADYDITMDASGMVSYSFHNGAEFELLFMGPAHLLPSFILAPRV